jgi:flavin-dependent dehydrogenase
MPARDMRADVTVIGGGPVGLAYAIWLKQERPKTRVVVLEQQTSPGFKIGESLLSVTVHGLYSLGFTVPLMRRLFANKAGLQFWYTDAENDGLHTHIEIILSETFQVERRPFEIAFQDIARRQGVVLRTGAKVLPDESRIGAHGSEVVYEGEDGTQATVETRLVVDATGPRSVLPRHFGFWRKPEGHVDANAYWGYFRRKSDPDIPSWRSGASRNICFPEGWVWFINLCSWQKASERGLEALVDDVLDRGEPDEHVPTRMELSKRHGVPYEMVTSIGIVPRDDMDPSKELPREERFGFYLDRYPALGEVMSHFELVEGLYEPLPPFIAIERLMHDSERYAGDGWLVIGDAAMFVNPIFSPGLAYGMASAYTALQASLRALAEDDFTEQRFSGYEEYARRLFDALASENDMLYRGFRHVDSYERTLMVKFFSGIKDAVRQLNEMRG